MPTCILWKDLFEEAVFSAAENKISSYKGQLVARWKKPSKETLSFGRKTAIGEYVNVWIFFL